MGSRRFSQCLMSLDAVCFDDIMFLPNGPICCLFRAQFWMVSIVRLGHQPSIISFLLVFSSGGFETKSCWLTVNPLPPGRKSTSC